MRDDQPCFDGLAESHFVGEDAAALGDALERERHRLDLVRVGIDAPTPLRRHVATFLARPTQADEFLGVEATVDGMQDN